jgi:pyruvate,orthophosphate dikinase
MTGNDSYIYRFSERMIDGNGSMCAELGGKGAGLAEMTLLSIPVPPGFTIPTAACRHYLEHGENPPGLDEQLSTALQWLEMEHNRKFDDPWNPLLVSVRSGAAVSMPGMMDTVLNVGLNRRTVNGLARRHGSMRFALDSYRRLLQMFGSIALQVPKTKFDQIIKAIEQHEDVMADSDISEVGLWKAIDRFQEVILLGTR